MTTPLAQACMACSKANRVSDLLWFIWGYYPFRIGYTSSLAANLSFDAYDSKFGFLSRRGGRGRVWAYGVIQQNSLLSQAMQPASDRRYSGTFDLRNAAKKKKKNSRMHQLAEVSCTQNPSPSVVTRQPQDTLHKAFRVREAPVPAFRYNNHHHSHIQ